jgi:type I restriction enzyme S subunit
MPEKLPKGWVRTTLGEIALPSRQRALPIDFPDLRYVGLENIEPHSMRLAQHPAYLAARSSSLRFWRGDVLYGKMRPYLNKVWVAEFDGLCSAEFLVFSNRNGLNSRFLAYRLNARDFVQFASRRVSGERPRVDFKRLSDFPIWLPPTAEQERIVVKLTAALSSMQRGDSAASRAQERLRRYRSAILNAAVSGELTNTLRQAQGRLFTSTGQQLLQNVLASRRSQWEKNVLSRASRTKTNPSPPRYNEPHPVDSSNTLPTIPDSWCWATLDQIVREGRPIVYGIIKPGPNDPDGVPYVRVKEMKDGKIDVASLMRTSKRRAKQFARSTLDAGDILISKDGTIGRVAVVPPALEGGNITQHVVRASIHQMISPSYVVWAIRSDFCQRWLAGETRGIALQGVNVADFRRLPIPIPPRDEQQRIASDVEERWSAANRLEEKLARQLVRSNATRELLLENAFAGRLIRQNSDDEPASLFLNRIRATRDIEATKVKGRTMPRAKTSATVITPKNLLAILSEKKGPIAPEQLFREAGFDFSQVDQFYRELLLIRDKLHEEWAKPSDTSAWPPRGLVLLQLKKGAVR